MNNQTRKRIDAVIADIEAAASIRSDIEYLIDQVNRKISEYRDVFDDAKRSIEEIRDEEQDKFDNLSQGLQQAEVGQNLENTVQVLNDAIYACESAEEIEDCQFDFDADETVNLLDEARG